MRFYECEGRSYPSVTTILSNTKTPQTKKALTNWKKRVGEVKATEIFDNACLRGTATHKLAEDYLLGNPLETSYAPAIPYWESMKKALGRISHVDYLEQKVYHDQHRYAGTLDCYGTFNRISNTLIDFKTADKYKDPSYIIDYYLQTVAYSAALKSLMGISTNQAAIIIGVPNRNPQIFVIDKPMMVIYWDMWLKRVNRFHQTFGEQYAKAS